MGHSTYSASRKKTSGSRSTGRGGGKARPMDLAQFSGMGLKEIEDYARHLDHEEKFIFDKDGNLLRAYKGGRSSVSFNHGDLFIDGAVTTHNHPGAGEGYGGTFSPADIMNFASSDWAETRAVASGQGEYNYIARRTANTTRQNSIDLYNRVNRDRADIQQRLVEAARNAPSNLSTTAKRQIYTGVIARYWAEVLPQYNFEYIARRSAYDYTQTKR